MIVYDDWKPHINIVQLMQEIPKQINRFIYAVFCTLAYLDFLQSHRLPVHVTSRSVYLTELPPTNLLINFKVCQCASVRIGGHVSLCKQNVKKK